MVLMPGVAASQVTRYLGGGGGPVTGPTPELIAALSATAGVGNWSRSMPTHVADDILIAVLEAGWSSPLTYSSGWTQVALERLGSGDNSGGTSHLVLWRRATSSSMPSLSVDTSNHAAGLVMSVRGCRTTGSPFRDVASDAQAASYIPFPSVTSEAATDLLIFAGTSGIDNNTTAGTAQAPSGGSGLSNAQKYAWVSTQGNDGGMAYIGTAEKAVPGATGAVTAGFTTSPGTQNNIGTALVLAAVDL